MSPSCLGLPARRQTRRRPVQAAIVLGAGVGRAQPMLFLPPVLAVTCTLTQGCKCRLVWDSGVSCMGIAAFIQSLAALFVKLTDGRVPVFELVVSYTHTLSPTMLSTSCICAPSPFLHVCRLLDLACVWQPRLRS